MNDFDQLQDHLRRWDQRRRLADALIWLPRGLLAGLIVALVVAVVARLYPSLTNAQVGQTAVILGLCGAAIMIVYLLAERRSLERRAQFADQQFGLKERALAAVQLADGRLQAPSGWSTLQLTETLRQMARVDAAVALPLRFIRVEMGALALAVALLGAAVLLPNPQEEILAQQQAIQEDIEEQVANLQALVDEIEANPLLTPEQREALLEPLEAAIRDLEAGNLTRAEAMAALNEAEMELRELAAADEARAADALQRELAETAADLLNSPLTAPLGEALQAGDLAASSEALASLAEQLAQLSPEELAALAEQLAQMGDALQNIDPELAAQLAEAAAALEAGDLAAAQAALDNVSGALAEAAAAQEAAAQAQAAADALAEGGDAVAQTGEAGDQAGSTGENGGEGSGGEGDPSDAGGDSGAGSGSDATNGEQSGSGGLGQGGGPADSLYIPDLVDLSDFEGVDIELPAECLADPSSCGPLLREWETEFGDEQSRVPYYDVYREYSQSAYEALNDDLIPLGMKGLVRDYFSSLEPGQ
jgi:hypothetical protein